MPNTIKIRASAKINLCLDIIKKTPSGYHQIRTVLQEIPEMHDDIAIKETKTFDSLSMFFSPKKTDSKTTVQRNDLIKNPHNNLAFKALLLIKKSYNKKLAKKFASIVIKKNIPLSSGLGGASSDAAAVLKGLNKLWNLKISTKKLQILAAKLGMDVPFFIVGGTALGTHFGEKITPLPPIKNIKFKISARSGKQASKKNISKTTSAYASLDLSLCGKNLAKTIKLLTILRKNLSLPLLSLLHNDFETIAPTKSGCHLSGSGPSTFEIRF